MDCIIDISGNCEHASEGKLQNARNKGILDLQCIKKCIVFNLGGHLTLSSHPHAISEGQTLLSDFPA